MRCACVPLLLRMGAYRGHFHSLKESLPEDPMAQLGIAIILLFLQQGSGESPNRDRVAPESYIWAC